MDIGTYKRKAKEKARAISTRLLCETREKYSRSGNSLTLRRLDWHLIHTSSLFSQGGSHQTIPSAT